MKKVRKPSQQMQSELGGHECRLAMMLVESSNFQAFGDDGFCLGSLVAMVVSGGLHHTPLARALSGIHDPFYKEISIPIPDVRTERVVLNHRLRLDDPTLSSVGVIVFFFLLPDFPGIKA